jgi:uncharacterized protein YqgV (UPF0045/DUF77 family)
VVDIAAQVNLYPLRQETLLPAIDTALQIFHDHGLDVEPGAMNNVIAGDDAAMSACPRARNEAAFLLTSPR